MRGVRTSPVIQRPVSAPSRETFTVRASSEERNVGFFAVTLGTLYSGRQSVDDMIERILAFITPWEKYSTISLYKHAHTHTHYRHIHKHTHVRTYVHACMPVY